MGSTSSRPRSSSSNISSNLSFSFIGHALSFLFSYVNKRLGHSVLLGIYRIKIWLAAPLLNKYFNLWPQHYRFLFSHLYARGCNGLLDLFKYACINRLRQNLNGLLERI